MYSSSGATIRADLNIKVEEAAGAEDFLIAQRILPPQSVAAKSGTYPKLKIAEAQLMTPGSTLRSDEGSYSEVTRKWTTDTYDCLDRGLEERVDDAVAKDVGRFFNVEAAKARLCMRNMLLDAEVRAAAAIMSTSNFGSATNSAVAYTDALIATIDFPRDVQDAIARIRAKGARCNTIAMSGTVLDRLSRSTLLRSFIRGTLTGELKDPVNAKNIAAVFADKGITQCLVGDTYVDNGKKGQAASTAAVWGTTYVWVGYCNPGASTPEDGGAGFSFYWNQEGGLYVTESYRDDKRRSNIVRVRQNTIEKITDGTAGTLIATQWS